MEVYPNKYIEAYCESLKTPTKFLNALIDLGLAEEGQYFPAEDYVQVLNEAVWDLIPNVEWYEVRDYIARVANQPSDGYFTLNPVDEFQQISSDTMILNRYNLGQIMYKRGINPDAKSDWCGASDDKDSPYDGLLNS